MSPPINIGEFVKLYGASGHFTVPIPSEGQIKPVYGLPKTIPWGMNFYDVPEAKLRPIHPKFFMFDEQGYFYMSPKEVVDDIVKHYNRTSFKADTQTVTFTIGKDFPEYATIPGWKMMELSVVKKPFNSEGYIK